MCTKTEIATEPDRLEQSIGASSSLGLDGVQDSMPDADGDLHRQLREIHSLLEDAHRQSKEIPRLAYFIEMALVECLCKLERSAGSNPS